MGAGQRLPFFPLLEHPDFGLTLHPFDLATNKTLALIGRAEVRDWVDIISCHTALQAFGLLVWAACAKTLAWGRTLFWSKPGAQRAMPNLIWKGWPLTGRLRTRRGWEIYGAECWLKPKKSAPFCRRTMSDNACWTARRACSKAPCRH